jgi:hypothetical protein
VTVETLHEAIHVVLRSGPLLPAQIAEQIEARGLWVRPSDGRPPAAKQIGARVRRETYRDQFTITPDRRISSTR